MSPLEHFLRDLAVVLVTAGAVTLLFLRLRWPVVAGYLVAGLIVGPSLPPNWITDESTIRLLSELGVILLMFSIGLEFRLDRLLSSGPAAALAATVEIGLMLALGFGAGRAFGWSVLASLFFGGAVAVCSTMILAKVLEARPVARDLKDTVFSLTLFEDIGAMIIIALLTAAATGEGLSGGALAGVVGRLIGTLTLILGVGLAVVPRAARWIIRLRQPETTLVTMVGLAFGLSWLAAAAGFSVALGAFLAGLLVAESGAGRLVAAEVRPLRDIFGAIFFVATGMQLDLGLLAQHLGLALGLLGVVVVGKPLAVTVGVFLSGRGLRTAIMAGLSLAQIGEFSFILAGVGAALGVVPQAFVVAAVAVSVVTAFLAPWLAGASDRVAALVDRKLPHRLQMAASLYAAWVEALRHTTTAVTPWARVRRSARWLALDAVAVAGLVITGSTIRDGLVARAVAAGAGHAAASWGVGVVTLLLVFPFLVGILRITGSLGAEMAELAIPRNPKIKVDNGRAPRRVLGVAVQVAALLATAGPIIVLTQPFLPPLSGLAVLGVLLLLFGGIFWRRATDLFGHFRAGAELVAATLAKQSRQESVEFDPVRQMLPGLGDFAPVRVGEGTAATGRTLGELDLRGRTGATVVALLRGEERIVFPEADQRLVAGDLVAVTGSHDAIDAATTILTHAEGAGS